MIKLKPILLTTIIFILLFCSCRNNYTPKPYGFMRIDFPEKKYKRSTDKLPYSFEYPVYSVIKPDTSRIAEPFWINIEFPGYNGKIHISYKKVHGNLAEYTEDARKLAYKHTVKADAIDEKLINNKENKVYGILYDIKGNTASSVQFFLTDSTKDFLRGALYFRSHPNKDSMEIVINFFKKDVDHFIETFTWK